MVNKINKPEPPTDDTDFEIRFYESLIEKKSDFVEALAALGDLYTKKGFYEKGLIVDEKLATLRPDDAIVLYNLACSYSLVNNLDKALRTIKQAVECGYDNLDHLNQDPDLLNLRKDSRFRRYFLKITADNQSKPSV